MSSKIEGIPDGWELIAFRHAVTGDYFLNTLGLPERWTLNVSSESVFAIIRKIEKVKAKQYRRFANAVEFSKHWGRAVMQKNKGRGQGPNYYAVVAAERYFVFFYCGRSTFQLTWKEAFEKLVFSDRTPFGVDVTEEGGYCDE